jgi:hypothetical protein
MKTQFNIYPTLLDAYTDYLRSSDIYDKYWGFADEPPFTDKEFHQKQFDKLIDKINRVPLAWDDSEAADRGAAFNEIVDCMILNKNSEKMQFERVKTPPDWSVTHIGAEYRERTFIFPLDLCREFARYFKGAQPQVFCEASLPTTYGDVLLYGYIDELMPTSIHDIKTTSKYEVGKFKHNMQRRVYSYILNQNGNNISDFEYNVAEITVKGSTVTDYQTFTEHYAYDHCQAEIEPLRATVENFIEFLNENRELITDKKIFNVLSSESRDKT